MALNSVLFIPVSSPSGIGEYMRSLMIANALKLRWPEVAIHFILNEQVSYLNDCPYVVHTCKGSPTKDAVGVTNIMDAIQPELVIFDASGRGSQFTHAKALGAKVAFISQHKKKRNRGLKLNRLLHTDIHWVAQPNYCIKPLSLWQRAKLMLMNKPAPKNVGPVFEVPDSQYQLTLLQQCELKAQAYVLFTAGSGGHKVKGQLATEIFLQAAKDFSEKTNIQCLVIFGSNYPHTLPQTDTSKVKCFKGFSNHDFMSLILNAKICVVSAGDTLLQCIALHKVCVATPVSPDQPSRLKQCSKQHLVVAAEPQSNHIVERAIALVTEGNNTQQQILASMKKQLPVNALDNMIDDIASLFSHQALQVNTSSSTTKEIK